ncbi:MAG: DUF3883 domain-containing protein [Bacillaceae bacterium]|nr:DUF3883 domain-containing protein [Bacillaceae bacterium]
MAKTEVMKDFLKENSIKAIEEFLSYYKESSQANFENNVLRLLYEQLKLDDVSKITIGHYLKIFPYESNKLTSQQHYKRSFFKFLYAFNYLENSTGFNDIFNKKENCVKYFKQLKQKNKNEEFQRNNNDNKDSFITIEELLSIQKVIETESTKIETLKMQFCWYAIFELGIPIEEIKKEISSDNYSDGKLYTSKGAFEIPKKFELMFIELSKRNSDYNGFATLNSLIAQIGETAKMRRRLLPRMVKRAREEYMIKCANCYNSYTNLSHYWESINDRIVCKKCADSLKKKLNDDVKVKKIANMVFDFGAIEDNLTMLYTYNDYKKKLNKVNIDYLELHKYQIEIGKLGELYVYEKECEKLKGTQYLYKIDEKKALDPSNGYDILSYTRDGKPLYIEVKATVGSEDEFYLTENEIKTAEELKKSGKTYLIYFIKKIMSDNPELIIIDDIFFNTDYKMYPAKWKVTRI